MRIHSYIWAVDQMLLQCFDRWIWRSWLLIGIEPGQLEIIFLGKKQETSYLQHQQEKQIQIRKSWLREKCTSFAKIKPIKNVLYNDKTQDE